MNGWMVEWMKCVNSHGMDSHEISYMIPRGWYLQTLVIPRLFSTTTGWIALKFATDIRGAQRMYHDNFDGFPTFHLAPSAGKSFPEKCYMLLYWWMDEHKLLMILVSPWLVLCSDHQVKIWFCPILRFMSKYELHSKYEIHQPQLHFGFSAN